MNSSNAKLARVRIVLVGLALVTVGACTKLTEVDWTRVTNGTEPASGGAAGESSGASESEGGAGGVASEELRAGTDGGGVEGGGAESGGAADAAASGAGAAP